MSQLPVPPPTKKRPRHLQDPDNLHREVRSRTDSGPMHLEPVQKWVLSILAFVTIIHLSGGLVVAALVIDPDRSTDRIGLIAIAAAFGIVAVAAFLAIHRKPMLSPWLLVGLVPAAVGLVLVLR